MSSDVVARRVTRRWGAGSAGVVRLLVASDESLTGVAIAERVGVTQPRVSQILKQLADLGGVVVAKPGGYVGEASVLLDLYRTRTRPHLVAPESYWYSTKPLAGQARRLVTLAGEPGVSIASSADLGPDLSVPWHHPTVAIAYVLGVLDVAGAGLVPAEGRADASVIVRRTDDAGLLSPAGPWVGEADGLPLVDPCQQWWDLNDLGGDDRVQAADRLRAAIFARTVPRTR